MASQLSGIAIILFIAFGSLTFILLFIFAKRQITRFALKSRRGPHVPVAFDAPKHLRLEIERRLDTIDKIQCEPWLLNPSLKEQFENEDVNQLTPLHLFRMKVVDDVKVLSNLIRSRNSFMARRFHENTMQYYLRLHKDGAMPTIDAQSLYKFLTLYEHARHQPQEFGYTEYCEFVQLLKVVRADILQLNENTPNHNENKSKCKAREDEVLMDESATPLLNRSKACTKNSLSVRKFAHETSV